MLEVHQSPSSQSIETSPHSSNSNDEALFATSESRYQGPKTLPFQTLQIL
jgi:hypothetical protein